MKQNKVIALVGPTGSGKTAWAKVFAKKYKVKIISADSRQIYKGMNIGTAKDISLHEDLVDIIEPNKSYSVAQFQKDAEDIINRYLSLSEVPLLVGGSGLYIESVLHGYIIPDLKEHSLEVRKSLEKLSEHKLVQKLKKLDPASLLKIDPKNKRRLIRAIEVSMMTRKPFSTLQKKKKPKYKILIIGIKTDRETLYAKVDARIDKMIKDGLVEEVRSLLGKYGRSTIAFNTIGYKEIIDYFDGKYTLKDAITKIKFNTHAYIRRQDTWFRRDKNIKWVSSISQAEKLIKKFLL